MIEGYVPNPPAHGCMSCCDAVCVHFREKLDAVERERDELREDRDKWWRRSAKQGAEILDMQDQLSAVQRENAEAREALRCADDMNSAVEILAKAVLHHEPTAQWWDWLGACQEKYRAARAALSRKEET